MSEFTIRRFERHLHGYFHASVVVDGQSIYLHRKFGSWLAPGEIDGRIVYKEPSQEIKEELQRRAKATERGGG